MEGLEFIVLLMTALTVIVILVILLIYYRIKNDNKTASVEELRNNLNAMRFEKLEEKIESLKVLSNAERVVLKEVINGKTNREIGDLLFKSEGTVKNQRKSIMDKLGTSNVVELIKVLAAEK